MMFQTIICRQLNEYPIDWNFFKSRKAEGKKLLNNSRSEEGEKEGGTMSRQMLRQALFDERYRDDTVKEVKRISLNDIMLMEM